MSLQITDGFINNMESQYIYKLSVMGAIPQTNQNTSPLSVSIVCSDGTLVVNYGILLRFSQLFLEVVSPLFDDCQTCEKMLLLPDFNVETVIQLVDLQTKGETWLHREEDRTKITQLLIALDCRVITQLNLEVSPHGGQCPYCYW